MLPSRNARRGLLAPPGIIRINRGLIAETGVIPAGLHLFQDSHPFTPLQGRRTVVEGKGGRDQNIFLVHGLFQEADKENSNNRVYPYEVLAPAVQDIQEDIGERAVTGEFDHPPDAKIHMDRISHLLTKVWMDQKKVYGEAEVLDDQPLGRCLRNLFERRVRTGISSRGVGDMEVRESHGGQEYYEVMPGYAFVTWDAVSEPSVRGATLKIVKESRRAVGPRPVTENRHRVERYERMLLEEVDRHFG